MNELNKSMVNEFQGEIYYGTKEQLNKIDKEGYNYFWYQKDGENSLVTFSLDEVKGKFESLKSGVEQSEYKPIALMKALKEIRILYNTDIQSQILTETKSPSNELEANDIELIKQSGKLHDVREDKFLGCTFRKIGEEWEHSAWKEILEKKENEKYLPSYTQIEVDDPLDDDVKIIKYNKNGNVGYIFHHDILHLLDEFRCSLINGRDGECESYVDKINKMRQKIYSLSLDQDFQKPENTEDVFFKKISKYEEIAEDTGMTVFNDLNDLNDLKDKIIKIDNITEEDMLTRVKGLEEVFKNYDW